MKCGACYTLAEKSWWDTDAGIAPHVESLDLDNMPELPHHGSRFGLIGFCCDMGLEHGSGISGAADAPAAVRQALQTLLLPTQQPVTFYDAGNIVCMEGRFQDSQDSLAAAITSFKKQSIRPIVIGGGTETSWGHYRGMMAVNPCNHLAVVNFSSCLALQSGESAVSRSAFWQIKEQHKAQQLDLSYACIGVQPTANTLEEFDTAHDMGAYIFPPELLQHGTLDDIELSLEDIIKQAENVFLSINLNVFASAYAPGVVRPQPLGLTPWQVLPLIRQLVLSGKVSGIEILGLNPTADHQDMTASLAAHLVLQFVCAFV